MQVGDLLHAEPAEFTATDSAGHVITAPIVHFDDVGATARARLDVISWGETKAFTHLNRIDLEDYLGAVLKNVKRIVTFWPVLTTPKSCLKVKPRC